MRPDQFQSLIRRILKEEVEKSDADTSIYQRVPEVTHDKDYKEIVPHKRDTKSKDQLLDDITKVVKDIDSSFTVGWDDHDDISISARDLFRIRIIPKWENNYCIEAFTRNEDRIYVTGQDWEQVKKFVKVNLKNATVATDKAYDKTVKSREDQTKAPDKGLNQKDKPKTLPLTSESPKESKNKDKNYTEKQTKKEADLPNQPMKEVGEVKTQLQHKVQDPVKLRKRKPDTKITIKI